MNVGLGADDWLALGALVFVIGCAVVLIVGDANRTIGWHSPPSSAQASFDETTPLLTLNAKLQYAFFPLSIMAIGLIRLTFVFLYRRIFRGKWFSIINWTLFGIIIAWMITFVFATLFQCGTHFWAFWGSQLDFATYCPTDFEVNAGLSMSDVIIDIFILILPVKPVLDLNMQAHRKFLVLIVFALGIFSVAAGMTRMVLLMEVLYYNYGSNDKLFGLAGTSDPLGIVGTALWWSYIEIGVGCLVSNMPAVIGFFKGSKNPLKSLIQQISLHSLGSFRNGSNGSPKNTNNDLENQELKSHANADLQSRATSEETGPASYHKN